MTCRHFHVVTVEAFGFPAFRKPRKDHRDLYGCRQTSGLFDKLRRRLPVSTASRRIGKLRRRVSGTDNPRRMDMAAAVALITEDLRHRSEESDFLIRSDRKNVVFVLQQHRAFRSGPSRKRRVLFDPERRPVFQRLFRIFRKPDYPRSRIVDAGLRKLSFTYRVAGFGFHIAAAARHRQVAAGPKRFDPVVETSPVGDDETVEAPFVS